MRALYFCPMVSSSFFFFLPRLISAVAHWMSTILLHMVWPYCEFKECRYCCCTRLAGNTGRKNDAKNRHLRTIAQLSRTDIVATEEYIDNRKKIVKQQYLHMSSQYGELRPTSSWDRFVSLGHPANFNGFRVLASLVERRRSQEANQVLNDVWPSPGLIHYIGLYILGAIVPLRNFARCIVHFASKSCALLHWQRYCTALE